MYDVTKFFRDEPYLYRSCADGIIWRCVSEVEMLSVLEACHSSPVDGIIVVSRLPIRSCNVATIGQTSTKMLMSSPRHVIGVKEMEVFLEGKSSLKISFLYLSCFVCGALTLWALLFVLMG